MKELPLKYKNEILAFCKEDESLANPRKVKITIPKQTAIAFVSWRGANRIEINEAKTRFDGWEAMYKTKEILEINKKIQQFIDRTQVFGRKNFKNPDWLWEEVLWNYRSEIGETFNPKKVKWI